MVIVGFDARADRKDVGIKNNVAGIEIKSLDQQVIATLANGSPSIKRISLTVFIERHYNNGGSVSLT